MKRGADGLAWSLQWIVGLAVGGFVGLRIVFNDGRPLSHPWFSTEHASMLLWGAGMIGGPLYRRKYAAAQLENSMALCRNSRPNPWRVRCGAVSSTSAVSRARFMR